MSDHSREQLFVAAQPTKKNLSPSRLHQDSDLANEHDNESIKRQQQLQQKGSSKQVTTSSSSTSKYLSIELNNNSIVQQPSSSERALLTSESLTTMDSANRNQQQQQPRKAEVKATNGSLTTGNVVQTPAYSSIFTSPSYNRSISPAQEIAQQQQQPQHHHRPQKATTQLNQTSSAARRGSKLRKQDAADSVEIPTLVSLDRSLSQKKLSTFEFADSDDVKRANADKDLEVDDEYDDDEDDDDDDDSRHNNHDEESDDLNYEKQPFKSSSKFKHSKGRKNQPANQHSHRCQLASNDKRLRCTELDSHKSPYAKISFSESRPPSFGTCQAAFNHFNNNNRHHHEAASNGSAKLDGWQIPVQCVRCNCTKCIKKLKVNDNTIQMEPYAKSYTRTKSMHLVLKSIILVLLTLLLSMMFIGIIMATHYLPSVFDRVLNATRSFNVTIAGR